MVDQVEEFVSSYIRAWSTEDDTERRELVERLYAADAEFFADEPGDDAVRRRGHAEIVENITQVNQRLTQGHGLSTESTGHAENHDLLRVRWRMLAPTGEVAMTGTNVLLLGEDRSIVRDYILIG